jgi:hypothetical protein
MLRLCGGLITDADTDCPPALGLDWTEDPEKCSVCNDELIGESDENEMVGPPFDDWHVICHAPSDDEEKHCDPREKNG